MFILKVVKVVCFDTVLQVLILKRLTLRQNCTKWPLATSVDSRGVAVGRRTSASGAVRRTAGGRAWVGGASFPTGPKSVIAKATASRRKDGAHLTKPL